MSHRWFAAPALVFVLGGCGGSDAIGPDPEPLPPSLQLQTFLSAATSPELSSPVFLTQPLDDGRIFVAMLSGRINIYRNGVLQPTPFLDIRSRVLTGGERGMFSVAFHPQYATNRYFYVFYTATNPVGEIRIERFTATANPDVADPASGKVILRVDHSTYENHNGGTVTFGPDGMLWTAFGDGGNAAGSGPDPLGNGQNYNSLLGAVLRIDVNTGDPYSIPATNPFVGVANRRGEVWAKGLRNPWRFSFDAPTGNLYIADVGHRAREEVNVVPYATGGRNFGWPIMEGNICFPPAATCDQTGFTLPAIDYPHAGTGCTGAVTGGYVYRGSDIPGLRGHYLYADYCHQWLRSFRFDNGVVADATTWSVTPDRFRSFGLDFRGEMYLVGLSTIYKIVEGT